MTFAVLVLTGAALVGAGGLITIPGRTFTVGLVVQVLGCVLLGAGGLWALVTGGEAGSAFTSAFDPRIGVDGLSGLFLGVLGAVGAAALVFAVLEPGQPSGRCGDRRPVSRLFVARRRASPRRATRHVPPRWGGRRRSRRPR